MMLVKALTQEEVDEVLNQFKQRSQAVKERVFDLVINSGGCISLDDAYNMDEHDFMLVQKQIIELIEMRSKLKQSKK